MPFKFTCPKCHRQNPLPDDHTGQEVVCAQCGSKFRVRPPRRQKTSDKLPLPAAEASPASLSTVQASEVTNDGIRLLWGVGDRILNLYEVTGLVGDDLYGQAYRVHHHGWMVDVNVKTPSPEILGRPASQETLVREAEAWAALGLHPNVVTCYYVRTLGTAPRIFTEWVDGSMLQDWIISRRLYDGQPRQVLEAVLDVAIQTVRGLLHARQAGLTHGSVRSDDILVEADRTARVTHFGLIRALELARRSRRVARRTGQLNTGTLSTDPSKPAARRPDTWFFAVTVMEMLMGNHDWRREGPSAAEQARAALAGGKGPVSAPEALIALIERCLSDETEGVPLAELHDSLVAIYREACGSEYWRLEVDAEAQKAEALSNAGLARWDLGAADEAEKLFDMAMAVNPECWAALYNQGLLQWRSDRLTFKNLMAQLETIPQGWRRWQFRGQLAAEQGDSRAQQWLDEALAEVPANSLEAIQLATLRRQLGEGHPVKAPAVVCFPVRAPRRETAVVRSASQQFEERLDECKAAAESGQWKAAAEALVQARLTPGFDRNPTLQAYARVIARHQGRGGLRELTPGGQLEGHPDAVLDVALNLDGNVAVSVGADRTLRVWDLATQTCTLTLDGHDDSVVAVAITPDATLAATASYDKTVRTWDLAAGKPLKTLQGHEDNVLSVAMTPDGRVLVSASQDKTVRVWNGSTGRCLQVLTGHSEACMGVAVSHDGRVAVSASYDKTLRQWDLATGECLKVLEGHRDAIWGLALTADGRYLASSGDDKTIRIWDIEAGKILQVLRGHTDIVPRVAITPDARYLVSASYDRTLRVWDVESGQCLESLGGHTDSVSSAALSLDGRQLVSASADRSIRLWQLAWSVEPRDQQDWDERARPVLFALLQARLRRKAGRRAAVSSEEFEQLLGDVANCGYGWLSPNGIKAQVEAILGVTVLWWEPSAAMQAEAAQELAVFSEPRVLEQRAEAESYARSATPAAPAERPADAASEAASPAAAAAPEPLVEAPPILETPATADALPTPDLAPPAAAPLPTSEPSLLGAPDLAPLMAEPILADLSEVNTPILLGPDGQPDLSLPPLGLPPEPGLLSAQPLPLADLPLLPPPVAETLAPPSVEDLSPGGARPAPVKKGRDGRETAEASVATEEKPEEEHENGVALAVESEPQTETEPSPHPVDEDRTQELILPEDHTHVPAALNVAAPAPTPTPAAPLAPPVPLQQLGKQEEFIGPIRRAELEAAAKRARLAAEEAAKATAQAVAPVQPVEPAPLPAPEAEPVEEAAENVGLFIADEDVQSQGKRPARKSGTIYTPAENLLKVSRPEAPTPALAGPSEAAVPLKRPAHEDVWEVGDTLLNLYQVTQFLGEGTMGKVYRVLHPGWNLELAMRTPRAAIHANKTVLSKWLSEAQRWAELGTHPHVVSCYYARTAHGVPRIFMEHVESGTLSTWIHSGKLYAGGSDLAIQRIIDVAIQVARGLAYAHERELIHQDVKPGNVLMTCDGTAKVSDFGLGRSWEGTLDEDRLPPGRELLTNIGGLTPAYASPEQLSKQELTWRTDIWSWGLLVLEMFTGEVIWGSGRQAAKALDDYLMYGTDNADIPPMPESLSTLLKECFQDKAERRPDTLGAIAERLQGIYADLAGRDYPREVGSAPDLKAATLNNQALAAQDLGHSEHTEKLFSHSLSANQNSLHTIYNNGLLLLRSGRMSFEALKEALGGAAPSPGNDWEVPYLQGWLHIERGEEEEARRLLDEAHRQAFNDPDGQEAITRAAGLARAYNSNLSVLTAHGSPAWGVDLTDDAEFAISASDDNTLRVWDVATGRCIRLLEGHTGAVMSVALSPEGHVALSGSEDSLVRVWNVGIGEAVHELEGHTDSVTGVAISAKKGASCSLDGTVRIWDIEAGYSTKTLKTDEPNSLTALAMSADMERVLAAEETGDILLWNVPEGKMERALKGHNERVNAIAMTPDGKLAVSASDDGTLRVWDLETGATRHLLEGHHGWVNGVDLSHDGTTIISAGWDKTLRVWEVATGRCLYALAGHENHIRAVALTPNGKQAVSVTTDGAMGFWKLPEELAEAPFVVVRARASGHRSVDREHFVEAMERAAQLKDEEKWSDAIESLNDARNLPGYEWSPVGVNLTDALALHGGRGPLRGVWTSNILEAGQRSMRTVAVNQTGRLAVVGNGNGQVQVWDLMAGRAIRSLPAHERGVHSVAITEDGYTAFSAGADATIQVWNLPQSKSVGTLQGHTEAIWQVDCTPDGQLLLSGSWDETVRLWEVGTGRCARIFKGHDGPVLAVALSPDGRLAVSGSSDNTVRLWEVASGRCVRVFEGHDDLISTVAFMGDGSRILSGSNDHSLRVWDAESGKCLAQLQGHRGPVAAAVVSVDGKLVVSGSWDWTVRVWEVPSGRCLRILDGHLGAVRGVALYRDGRHGLSISEDGTMRQWLFDWVLEPHAQAEWDDGARVFLAEFSAHLRRKGGGRRVKWSEDEFDDLMQTLAQNGFGWLKREGVEAELARMAPPES